MTNEGLADELIARLNALIANDDIRRGDRGSPLPALAGSAARGASQRDRQEGVQSWGREGAWGTLDYLAPEDPEGIGRITNLRSFARFVRNGGGTWENGEPTLQERLDHAHFFELWADYYSQALRDGHENKQSKLHGYR